MAAAQPANDKQPAAVEQRVTAKVRAQAKAKYREGVEHLRKQQYGLAIAAFRDAHQLDPRPAYMYNLGVSYRLKGDARAAYDHFQSYLKAEPRGRLARAARRYADEQAARLERENERMRRERALVEARQRAEVQAQESQERAMAAERGQKEALAAAQAEVERSQRVAAAALADRDEVLRVARSQRGSGLRVAGAALIAAGGLVAGAGAWAGLDAREAHGELDGIGDGDVWDRSREWLYERGVTSSRSTLVLSLTGAALLSGGVGLYYLGRRAARRSLERVGGTAGDSPAAIGGLYLGPALTRTGVGVLATGRF